MKIKMEIMLEVPDTKYCRSKVQGKFYICNYLNTTSNGWKCEMFPKHLHSDGYLFDIILDEDNIGVIKRKECLLSKVVN